jgi:hypothetical protein
MEAAVSKPVPATIPKLQQIALSADPASFNQQLLPFDTKKLIKLSLRFY